MTTMDIAPASDPHWHALLSGAARPAYGCLALRILMIRLTHAYQREGADRGAVVGELRAFFRDNFRFAGADYARIFTAPAVGGPSR